MKKLSKPLIAVLALICPTLAWAQGGVPASPIQFSGPTGRPLAGATVTVCTSAGTGFPCTPQASIYTNAGLTLASPNPVTTDGNGNLPVIFAAPGVYILSVTGSGITSTLVTATVAGTGGGNVVLNANNAFTGNNTHGGTETFTGGVTISTAPYSTTAAGTHSAAESFTAALTTCQNNGALYVGISGSTCWAGADIGAQLNSAYTSCPAATSVCHIVNVNATPASFTTPIVFTTKGKYFLLESLFPCVVTISASFGGCLNYTPVTATSAITIDVYDPAVTNEPIHTGMRNVGLLNNNCTTSGGCGSLAVGIQIGNTNGGLMDGLMDNIAVYGFNIGYQNSNVAATDVHWSNSFFQSNAVAEKIGTVQDWNLNGKWIANGNAFLAVPTKTPELHWTNPDLVGNSSLPVLDFTSAGSAGNPAHFFSVNGHYENGQNTAADLQYIAGNVDMYFAGGTMGNDSSSGTGSWYISCSGTQLNIEAVEFQSGRPVTQAILLNSPCRAGGQVGNFSPTNITTFFGGANAANNSVLVTNGNTANAAALWPIENILKAPIGIGDVAFTPATNAALHIKYNGTNFNGVRLTDTTTSRDSAFGPNTLAATRWSLRDITNSKELFGCDITGTGNCLFPQFIAPLAAGASDLGATALPWGNLWLGTAATNNLKLQPAAMAAARVLTVPDPLGAVTMPYVIASGTTTLTANAALAAVTSQAANTTAATNTLTTDSIEWSYASAPTAGDSLCHVSPYVTAGNVNFVRTNPTAAAQNVSAIVINWRVMR